MGLSIEYADALRYHEEYLLSANFGFSGDGRRGSHGLKLLNCAGDAKIGRHNFWAYNTVTGASRKRQKTDPPTSRGRFPENQKSKHFPN